MRTLNLKIFITIVLMIRLSDLFSQDPLVFQFDNIPILLNPALTANNEDYHQISSNLRNQWKNLLGDAAYKSGILAIEYGLGQSRDRYFGIGLLTSFERAGSANFGTDQFKPTISYNGILGKSSKSKTRFSVGTSVGPARVSIDEQKIIIPTPEPNLNPSKWYLDLSLGLNFNYVVYNRLNLNVGMSINHLNEPNTSLLAGGMSNLSRSTNLYLITEVHLNKSFSIIPNLLIFRQGNFSYELYGLKNRINFNQKILSYLQVGFQYLPNSLNTYALNLETKISPLLISLSIGRSKIELSEEYFQTIELGFNYYFKRSKSTNQDDK